MKTRNVWKKPTQPFNCDGCGTLIDPDKLVMYPKVEGEASMVCTTEPVIPFTWLDVEPNSDADEYKTCNICWHCFNKVQPDMWISERCWELTPQFRKFSELADCPTSEELLAQSEVLPDGTIVWPNGWAESPEQQAERAVEAAKLAALDKATDEARLA